MSLLNAIKEATASTETHTTGKNAAYYNKQKSAFVIEMASHENAVVRAAACSSTRIPTKALQATLRSERNEEVLRAILMNPALPTKDIIAFSESTTASVFDEDTELQEFLASRIRK